MKIIGIPKEIKPFEKRVSLVPDDCHKLINHYKKLNIDVKILIQSGAGLNAGFNDNDYINVNVNVNVNDNDNNNDILICDSIEEVYDKSDIIIKVKEPQEYEYELIKDTHIILAFFHFAANKELEDFFNSKKTKCIIYETIKDENNNYPILAPMSKIAGKQGFIVGHNYINSYITDINSIIISIIGIGNVGYSAFNTAVNLGYTNFNLIDINYNKLESIKLDNPNLNINILNSNEINSNEIKSNLMKSNIIISSIYNTGLQAERIINLEVLDNMNDNSIIIDIAIDQGGTTELSQPTTIENPFISYKNVKIYCVPNIPSTIPNEASIDISKSIVDYVMNNLEMIML